MNSLEPAVSIITIVKNNEKQLPRAIESVLKQSANNYEYIILNDGSTDGTGALIDRFAAADARIRPKHLKKNVGRALARNTAMDAANGRYLFFLDADDYLPQDALANLLEIATKNHADIVFGGIKAFDKFTGDWLAFHYTDGFINHERHGFTLEEYPDLVRNNTIVGRLFKRSMLLKNQIRFSTKRKNAEDVTFSFYSAYYAKRLSMVPDNKVYFYSVGNFLDAANASKVIDARDNILETLRFVCENNQKALISKMYQKSIFFAGYLGRAKRVFGDGAKLRNYLPTLVPLVEGVPGYVLDALPPYYQRYARALLAGDYDRALLLFNNRRRLSARIPPSPTVSSANLKPMQHGDPTHAIVNECRQLAQELDELYKSNSWRITAPLRKVANLMRMLKLML